MNQDTDKREGGTMNQDTDKRQKCREKRCLSYFDSTALGKIKASDDGWLILKSGKAICNRHIPDWYPTAIVIQGGGEGG